MRAAHLVYWNGETHEIEEGGVVPGPRRRGRHLTRMATRALGDPPDWSRDEWWLHDFPMGSMPINARTVNRRTAERWLKTPRWMQS